MKQLLKEIIKKSPLNTIACNWIEKRREKQELVEWEKNGKPNPPPHLIKQRAIQSHAKKYNIKVLVETGTYLGDMVEAMKSNFDKIYSIELSDELHQKAKTRFKGNNTIELIQGDSGVELKKLINKLDQPALFWLDGHYSAGVTARGDKDTPIYEELDHIFADNERQHVLLIDDARCFGKDPAYPSIEELSKYILSKKADVTITIENDSIRITPGKQ